MQKKKGISLIVLVITIIVMIILAAAIILSLNNAGIIGNANKAVAETNLAQMKELASMSWGTAYAEGKRTLSELKPAVMTDLEKSVSKEELSKYEVTVGLKGVTVVEKKEVPENWKESVTTIIDNVPIPKGFVASSATGENTKNEGFVIYEGTEEVNDENVEETKRSRNQYVWIPVDDFYSLGRRTYKCIANAGVEVELSVEKKEKIILMTQDNMPDLQQGNSVYSETTLNEMYNMYTSIKKYGGFYVARYEAGTDESISRANTILPGSDVRSMQNKYPYVALNWGSTTDVTDTTGGAVQVARSVYNNDSFGVSSTVMYLPMWYRIAEWIEENNTSINIITGDIRESYRYGNTYLTEFKKNEFVDGAKYIKISEANNISKWPTLYKSITTNKVAANSTGETDKEWLLTTGATDRTKLNNIYDLIGNVGEYDMYTAYKDSNYYRAMNGCTCVNGKYFGGRNMLEFNKTYLVAGFRLTLYIK